MVESAILIYGLTHGAINILACLQGCSDGLFLKRKYITGKNNSCLVNYICSCKDSDAEVYVKPGFFTFVVCLECLICPCYYCGFECADPGSKISACNFTNDNLQNSEPRKQEMKEENKGICHPDSNVEI